MPVPTTRIEADAGDGTMEYTHVGCRPYVGHYAVTVDAYRKPGKVHALNPGKGNGVFVGLCGTKVREGSDDHFLQDRRNVFPASPESRVTCRRCKSVIAKGGRS